jgi:long-chain acyl-CoA synthetase
MTQRVTERRWLAHYDPGVPHSLAPYPERTLVDDLAEAAREEPDATALVFKGARLSWRELDGLSEACAAALRALGVRPGDRMALLLPNCPQFLIAELGAWKAGATVVPLNPIYTERELLHPLVETGAETIVALTPFYARVKALQPRSALKRVIATNVKEHLPPLLRWLFTLFKERAEGHRVSIAPGDLWLRELLADYSCVPRQASAARPGDAALILLSGGTTGTPKGVVGTHQGLVVTGRQVLAWYRAGAPPQRERLVLPLPLFHSFAAVGAQSFALGSRATLVLVPNPRDIDDLVKTLEGARATLFAGVPTLYNAILNHPRVRAGRVDFRSMRMCLSGAAPLLAETQRRFESLTGSRILEAYSLTEAMLAISANPMHGVRKPGSVGMPVSDVEMRVVDAEQGERELAPGEVGEILIRAPQLMPGYWRNEDESRQALRAHGPGGAWLHTGDLGYLDEDGYLFVVDRLKDLMKPSGMQVWPREVEEVLAAHPAVAEVGVAGVQDPAKGEVVKAWVVLRDGAQASGDEIRGHCKARLAPYKVPAQVEFRDSLPKSMIGKVLRRKLVEEHRAAGDA